MPVMSPRRSRDDAVPAQHHPRANSVRLSVRHGRWVAGTSLVLLLSGVLWLLFHYFVAVPGDFGAAAHPLEAWWLRVHGAAAMGFLIVLGTVLPVHARRAWNLRRNRWTGAAVLGVIAALLVTGYALYYAGSEELRPWISGIHWVIGLIAAPTLVLHGLTGRQEAARREASYIRHHRHPQTPADRASGSGS
jgi:cation transport ATPase